MKSRKGKLPFFTPRLTAFLLFLSMLLTTVAVFPSSVYAVESEGEPLTEGQEPLPEEPLTLPDQTITTEETEFEHFGENTASTALVTSDTIYYDDDHTTVRPNGNRVDLAVGDTLTVRIQSEVTNFKSIEVSIDNTAVMTYQVVTQDNNGLMYIRVTALNVGIATVTAKVTYWINSSVTATEEASLELYVTMEDGIYAIKSCATHLPTSEGDYYLRVQNINNTSPNLYASTHTYGGILKDIYRYWQINYSGNGKYSIRPLINQDDYLSIAFDASDTFIWNIVEDNNYNWIIRYRGGGYEIASEFWDEYGLVLNTWSVYTGQYSSMEYYYQGKVRGMKLQDDTKCSESYLAPTYS